MVTCERRAGNTATPKSARRNVQKIYTTWDRTCRSTSKFVMKLVSPTLIPIVAENIGKNYGKNYWTGKGRKKRPFFYAEVHVSKISAVQVIGYCCFFHPVSQCVAYGHRP